MSVLFTSDPHFGHALAAHHRGFEDVAEHDQVLIDNWRKVVRPNNHVWVLGDLTVGRPFDALRIMDDLPGIKHFITGNHDPCHPMHRQAHKWQGYYLEVFESVQPFARRRIGGVDVLLSHFPYSKDRGPVRYTQWRLRNEGEWLLHGHTHGKERREGKEIHVGVDAWDMTPVHLNTIYDLMKTRIRDDRKIRDE